MPVALERKLKAQYGSHSSIPYKIMNSRGLMPHHSKPASTSMKKISIADMMKRKGAH